MTFLSRIILLASMMAAMTAIGILVPSEIIGSIDENIIYLLGYINHLGLFFNVSTLFEAWRVLGNFIIGALLFEGVLWVFHLGK